MTVGAATCAIAIDAMQQPADRARKWDGRILDPEIFFMGDYVVKFLNAGVLHLADKALRTIGFIDATVYRRRKYAVPGVNRKAVQAARTCPAPECATRRRPERTVPMMELVRSLNVIR